MWLHVELAELIIILHVMLAVVSGVKYGLRQMVSLVYKRVEVVINILVVVTMLVKKSIQQVPPMCFLKVIIELMDPLLS